MRTAAQLSTSELDAYRVTARRRAAERSVRLAQRREHALALANAAAALLKSKFGATTVYVFGSLARTDGFTEMSDLDLAVEGVHNTDFFRALAGVMALDRRFQIDLIDLADCAPSLARVVREEGKLL